MSEETKNENTTLEGSVFADVLGRLMMAHLSSAVDEEKALELAQWCEYDRETFRARLHGDPEAYPGDLSQLAYELGLSGEERQILAGAYCYERDYAHSVESPSEQEELEYLTEQVGLSLLEAERILTDSDLFLTDPGSHYGFAPEEALEVWREAPGRSPLRMFSTSTSTASLR